MKKFSYLAIAMWGAGTFASLSALAQAVVTDPAAAVPPVVYQSVFNESPTGVETKSVDWKKANAEVALFKRGHVDILKWEESQLREKAAGKSLPKNETKPEIKADPKPDAMPPKPAQPDQPVAPSVHKH